MRFTAGIGLSLALATSVLGATETTDVIVKDKRFLDGHCADYAGDLSIEHQVDIAGLVNLLTKYDVIKYIEGGESLTGEYIEKLQGADIAVNELLPITKEKLHGQRSWSESYAGNGYTLKAAEEAIALWTSKYNDKKSPKELKQAMSNSIRCSAAEVAAAKGNNLKFFLDYVDFAEAHQSKAKIEYFEVSVGESTYGPAVGTGNRFLEPKKWDGSRFFIINATFKNLDTESRMPVSGSLFIKHNGKEYEFDSVEPIMAEGYNIWLKKVNPLVTMRSKFVYRIPDEVKGDVYWRPGRNPDDVRLWVGSVEAAK